MEQVAERAIRVDVEALYEVPETTARDELELADGRVFDRYTAPVSLKTGRGLAAVGLSRHHGPDRAKTRGPAVRAPREGCRVVSHDLKIRNRWLETNVSSLTRSVTVRIRTHRESLHMHDIADDVLRLPERESISE
ncbi:hypothetical protein C8039_15930 [Halogeometricum sp. wsp3]|nr:hypothetical protein C8039_15930 [Halogeometricum sp. wsp3]